LQDKELGKWELVMKDEIDSLIRNQTWELTKLHAGKKKHWEAVKWILRYLNGYSDISLCFRSLDLKIQSYVDVDLTGEVDNNKNTIMFIYILGNTNMCWALKL
jgi:hypothetical protein